MQERQAKIMIDDDLEVSRQLLEGLLEDDYDLKVLDTGLACLQMAQEFKPDILLLDVMMPGLSGLQVCNQLKDSEATDDISILMVFAAISPEDKLKGYQSGCDDYLLKPIHKEELLAKIEVA